MDRMPLRRDEDATITRDDDGVPLGRCRVRARFEAPRPDRLAGADVRVSDVQWEPGVVLTDGQRYALRFADGYGIVVLFGLLGFDDGVTLQGLIGPGGVRIQ
jgi:hypothetical protein